MEPIVNLSGKYALIVDRMTFVQQAQVSNKTFGRLAMDLLERILKAGIKSSKMMLYLTNIETSQSKI